jgi:hypothetical protein
MEVDPEKESDLLSLQQMCFVHGLSRNESLISWVQHSFETCKEIRTKTPG